MRYLLRLSMGAGWWPYPSRRLWGQLLSVPSNCKKSPGFSGGCVPSKKVAGGIRNAVKSRDTSNGALDLGLRVLGSSASEIRAEAFAEISGEITKGLSAFVDAGIELNEGLDWQTTAGIKWRF